MAAYHIFPLDRDGKICGSVVVHRDSDEEALKAAEAVIDPGQAAEVWLRSRMVGTVRRAGSPLPPAGATL